MPNLKELPKSPVTQNNNVRNVENFSANDLIEIYSVQENIDVTRYFSSGDTVSLLECADTGYRFFYPFEVAGDEDFYKELQSEQEKRGLEYDLERADDHQLALAEIGASDKVLEIGCNTGKFLKKISTQAAEVCGLEFNSAAAEKARRRELDVRGESIEEHAGQNPEKYDIVCAFQVLEHVPAAGSFLTAALKALKPGGKLILSVPNNEPFFQRFGKYEVLNLPPHHVGLWNIGAFQKLCDFYDMDLVKYTRTGPSSFLGDMYVRAKFYAGIKSSARHHSFIDKVKIGAALPFAFLGSSMDYLQNDPGYSFLSVVFQKR